MFHKNIILESHSEKCQNFFSWNRNILPEYDFPGICFPEMEYNTIDFGGVFSLHDEPAEGITSSFKHAMKATEVYIAANYTKSAILP